MICGHTSAPNVATRGYQLSNVESVAPVLVGIGMGGFWSKVVKTNDCWLWIGSHQSDGYGTYWDSEQGKVVLAHRYIWTEYNGIIPGGMNILHKCDVPPCVRPDHLFMGTQGDNIIDMYNKGRGNREHINMGSRNGGAKITPDIVKIIRQLYSAGGISQQAIANLFGLSQSHIGTIVRGEHWASVE